MSSNFSVGESGQNRLLHYGVKGMQWGVKRAHPSYSSTQQHADRKQFGKRGAKRINRRLKRGHDHDRAVQIEKRNRIIKRAALISYGAYAAHKIVTVAAPTILGYIAGHKLAAAGAKAAADVLANSHGLPGGGFINLSFNAAKNVWE
jgi:hypothetical protein